MEGTDATGAAQVTEATRATDATEEHADTHGMRTLEISAKSGTKEKKGLKWSLFVAASGARNIVRSLRGDEVGVCQAMPHSATSFLRGDTELETAELIECSESCRDKNGNEAMEGRGREK